MGAIIGILSRMFSSAGIIVVILIGIVLDILEPIWAVLTYVFYGLIGLVALYFAFIIAITLYDAVTYYSLCIFYFFAGKPKPKMKDTLRDWQRKRRRERNKRQLEKKELAE